MPVCEPSPQEEQTSEGPVEERNKVTENQVPNPPIHHQKKKKKTSASEEQILLQTLARNIEKKANVPDDADRHFLLSLLPHLKSLPENVKLDVMGEFISILKRYNQQAALDNHKFPPPPTNFFPGPVSSETMTPHYFPLNTKSSGWIETQYQPIRTDSVSPESAAGSQAVSPLSDSSSICD